MPEKVKDFFFFLTGEIWTVYRFSLALLQGLIRVISSWVHPVLLWKRTSTLSIWTICFAWSWNSCYFLARTCINLCVFWLEWCHCTGINTLVRTGQTMKVIISLLVSYHATMYQTHVMFSKSFVSLCFLSEKEDYLEDSLCDITL